MDTLNPNNSPIFIISHKYFRGYESYLKYYVGNIRLFYPGSRIIIVDNNSLHAEDIFSTIEKDDNIMFLTNDIECKFELGAYQVGIRYLLEQNWFYEYVVMVQDTFVLKNKFDFNQLSTNNVKACTINSFYQDGVEAHTCMEVLTNLGLYDNLDKVTFCWCSSFIVRKEKIQQLYEYLKKIVITVRSQSCASERYLARILWELNDHKNYDIDGDRRDLHTKYDCHSVNMYDNVNSFFVKRAQQKNETTIDK